MGFHYHAARLENEAQDPRHDGWLFSGHAPEHRFEIAFDIGDGLKYFLSYRLLVFETLQLPRISLPKASSDDNPCEIIFSDIQLNVLDNSDDPGERAMRPRISHRFSKRNRRRDHFIEIPYLWDSHNG